MRYNHNLSYQHKLSTDMGYLIPIGTLEVLPGDTFIHSTSLLARVAPLVNPVMHNVNIRVHHWYVPNRILMSDWEDWITGKDSASDKPHIDMSTLQLEDTFLLDHMGIDPRYTGYIDALPIHAYNKIWNEFYRDQDLQTERDLYDSTLARCAWEKDYLTTARPSPQQGDPVSIGFAPGHTNVHGFSANGGDGSTSNTQYDSEGNPLDITYKPAILEANGTNKFINPYVDLSENVTGIQIDELRKALALQRFAEARARYGSRYVDYLRFLGVNPSDGRLDRPEYLGGGSQNINFSEILATAEGQTTNVGDMYGHGIAGVKSRRYRKMFEEHGWCITLLSVRPKTVYMDGVDKKFTRFGPMDHWQKELEILPWQEVKTSEVHYNGNAQDTFGYVPRYDEYRHEQSYVSGSFRIGPEEDWHMARHFDTVPTLNSSFIECTPTDRIYGDKNMPELLINCKHNIKAKRLVRENASLTGI